MICNLDDSSDSMEPPAMQARLEELRAHNLARIPGLAREQAADTPHSASLPTTRVPGRVYGVPLAAGSGVSTDPYPGRAATHIDRSLVPTYPPDIDWRNPRIPPQMLPSLNSFLPYPPGAMNGSRVELETGANRSFSGSPSHQEDERSAAEHHVTGQADSRNGTTSRVNVHSAGKISRYAQKSIH